MLQRSVMCKLDALSGLHREFARTGPAAPHQTVLQGCMTAAVSAVLCGP